MGYDPYNGCRIPQDLPPAAFAGTPYGFFPIGAEERRKLVDSANMVLSLLEGHPSHVSHRELSPAIQYVRQALWRAASTDSPDWFTLFREFGFPSYEIARELVRTLAELRRQSRDRDADGYHGAVERCDAAECRRTLSEFASGTDRHRESKPLAYILWSDGDDGRLVIGAADLPLTRLAMELGQSRPGRVYGVLGAWIVGQADIRTTRITIGRRLAKYLSPAGDYELTLAVARREVAKALAENGSEPTEGVA
jgi:hypothetical protein